MNEIRPALTPEEWETIGSGHRQRRPNDGPLPVYHPTRHGIAAANLRGQSFGFTHADLDEHARQAKELRDSERRWERLLERGIGSPEAAGKVRDHCRETAEWHESMAARLAALLPPR